MQKYIELDCSNQQMVNDEFDLILNEIATNQENLDNLLYSCRLKKYELLLKDIANFAGELSTLFPPTSGDSADSALARELFRKPVWQNLGVKLSRLVKHYKDKKNEDSQEFLGNLERIKVDIEHTPGLPDANEVENQASTKGMLGVYNEQCQETRRLVIEKFEGLDDGFRELFDNLRAEAKQCFTDEDGGRLADVQFEQENDSDWWENLANEVAALGQTDAYRATARRIGNALRRFACSSLSFRETLLPRIIPHFDCLDTGDTKNTPFRPKEFSEAQEVIDGIDSAAKHAVEDAFEAVRSLSQEPSMALYAAIEELRDAVIRTGGFTDAEHVWGEFYSEHRTEIWPNQFQAREADAKFRREWQQSVEKLKLLTK